MPPTAPSPGPTFGGIDFDAWDCGSFGTLYTATGNVWHEVKETIDGAPDAFPVTIPPSGVDVLRGYDDADAPIDPAAILPTGTTWEWLLLYTHPTIYTYTLPSAPWVGVQTHPTFPAAGTAQGTHVLTLLPPWMSTLPWGEMYHFSHGLFKFHINSLENVDINLASMGIECQWFLKWTLPEDAPPIGPYEPPPPPPVYPPTGGPPGGGIVNPGSVPTSVILRQQLEKANPGFVCDIRRHNIKNDVVTVFLAQKVALSLESYGMLLGFVNRSHVITQSRFTWQAHGGRSPYEEFTSAFRLEKIPGTLLPGAGTSNAAQDAAGTGAEIGMYHQLDVVGTGLDIAGLQ